MKKFYFEATEDSSKIRFAIYYEENPLIIVKLLTFINKGSILYKESNLFSSQNLFSIFIKKKDSQKIKEWLETQQGEIREPEEVNSQEFTPELH